MRTLALLLVLFLTIASAVFADAPTPRLNIPNPTKGSYDWEDAWYTFTGTVDGLASGGGTYASRPACSASYKTQLYGVTDCFDTTCAAGSGTIRCMTRCKLDGSAWEVLICASGSIAEAGGSDTEIQFNDSGGFGGDSELTYNKTTNVLSSGSFEVTGCDGASNNCYIKLRSNTSADPTAAGNNYSIIYNKGDDLYFQDDTDATQRIHYSDLTANHNTLFFNDNGQFRATDQCVDDGTCLKWDDIGGGILTMRNCDTSTSANPILRFQKWPDDCETPSAAIISEDIGEISFYSYDGTASGYAARILVEAGGAWSVGDHPSVFDIQTTADGETSAASRILINKDGEVSTSSLALTIDSDNAGSEPADGAGLIIEGGSGTDISVLYDDAENSLDITGLHHVSIDATAGLLNWGDNYSGQNIRVVQMGDNTAMWGVGDNWIGFAQNMYFDGTDWVRVGSGAAAVYDVNVGNVVAHTAPAGSPGETIGGSGQDVIWKSMYFTPTGRLAIEDSTPEAMLDVGSGSGVAGWFDSANEEGVLVDAGTQAGVMAVAGSDQASLILYDSGGALDQKTFRMINQAETTKLQLTNDAYTGIEYNFLTLDHATGDVLVSQDLSVSGTATGAIQDKGGQVFNVLAYGLVGDGDVDTDSGPNGEPGDCTAGTDNSSALSTLLETIRTAGTGGIIYFPPGVYRFDSTIDLKWLPPITWQGATGLFAQDDDSAPTGSVLLNCVDGILFLDNDTVGIVTYDNRVTSNQMFQDIAIQCNNRAADIGIALENGYNEGWIDNIYTGDCLYHIQIGDPGGDTDIAGGGAFNHRITNWRAYNNGATTGTGLYIVPQAQAGIMLTLDHVTLRQLSKGIDAQAPFALQLRNSLVESCADGSITLMGGNQVYIDNVHIENCCSSSGYDIWVKDRDDTDCTGAGGSACADVCADGSATCCDGGTLDGYKCSSSQVNDILHIKGSTFSSRSGGAGNPGPTIKFENYLSSLKFIVLSENSFATASGHPAFELGAVGNIATVHLQGNSNSTGYDFCGGTSCVGGDETYNGKVCDWGDGQANTFRGCYFPNDLGNGWILASAASVDISGNPVFRVTGTTPITDFTGGFPGQCIRMYADNAGVVVNDVDGTIDLAGDANLTMTTGDSLDLCMFEVDNWFETGRTRIDGTVVGTGAILGSGSGDVTVTFDSTTDETIKWSEGLDRFQCNEDLEVFGGLGVYSGSAPASRDEAAVDVYHSGSNGKGILIRDSSARTMQVFHDGSSTELDATKPYLASYSGDHVTVSAGTTASANVAIESPGGAIHLRTGGSRVDRIVINNAGDATILGGNDLILNNTANTYSISQRAVTDLSASTIVEWGNNIQNCAAGEVLEVASAAAGVVTLECDTDGIDNGVECIHFHPMEMRCAATNGCYYNWFGDVGNITYASNFFATDADDRGTIPFRVPDNLTGTTGTVIITWFGSAASCDGGAAADVCWAIQSTSLSESENFSTALTSAVGIQDLCTQVQTPMQSVKSSYVHGMTAGEMGYINIFRDVDGGTTGCTDDDFAANVFVLDVEFCYTADGPYNGQ